MTEVVARVLVVEVSLVLTPGQSASCEVREDLLTRRAQQGTGELQIAAPAARPDAGKAAKAGPAQEPMEDRLRLVVLLVPGGDPRAPLAVCDLFQTREAQLPCGGLQR